uniref:Uncharacterized protein n=1 Tax=Corethron hystrix TaxID=216773 RepID=A0A7S1BSE0_9STRA|mmetsp:Transcript_39411/g.92051  ORF Transcript_39411/g.92051 Transcript_39411/m.92051 type:complete len:231 (+) Transcript_39411:77-769(+)
MLPASFSVMASMSVTTSIFLFLAETSAFVPHRAFSPLPLYPTHPSACRSTTVADASDTSQATEVAPKEYTKLFGRLAEKYIMLDASAGLCCYSACSDCEFREPGGGYRMSEMSAARPKWIPCYEKREQPANNKEHTTKWSADIFGEGPAVTEEEFVEKVSAMAFAPPLGGSFCSAKDGKEIEPEIIRCFFRLLVREGSEKLTRHRMSTRMKELAGDEEGLNWKNFEGALQ